MGIPRLTQDLQPYSTPITLGDGDGKESLDRFKSVVIDGPSLVYHVYGKIYAYHSHYGSSTIGKIPTYSQINLGVQQLLTDLKSTGVSIIRIFFDGSLPPSKRATRLERLEKSRRQLENFRILHHSFSQPKSTEDSFDVSSALWHFLTLSSRQCTPSAPPFMVAAVANSLIQASEWKELVYVVDGEADGYCAAAAKANNAAVLSNDSDMIVYNLGENGCLASFHTLVLEQGTESQPRKIVKAHGLTPSQIARRLCVPDLLGFAFQRSKDGSVSTAEIIQRTKKANMNDLCKDKAWSGFCDQFKVDQIARYTNTNRQSYYFEPRISEIAFEVASGSFQLVTYLPVLLEDPMRDSSWAYGKELRKLAYSLLVNASERNSQTHSNHVTEFTRKGQRIASENVTLDSWEAVTTSCASFLKRYSGNLKECSKCSCTNSNLASIMYVRLALEIIKEHKQKVGKPMDRNTTIRVFHPVELEEAYTWNDIHLNANIQAVIYSLRMFKLLYEHACYIYGSIKEDSAQSIGDLVDMLHCLPPMEDVFLDPMQLAMRMGTIPYLQREAWLRRLIPNAANKGELEKIVTEKQNKISPRSIKKAGTDRAENAVRGGTKLDEKNKFNLLQDMR